MQSSESSYLIHWHPYAEEDLYAIIRFIAEDNTERAKSFGKTIYSKIQMLKHHPLMGREGRVLGTRELVVHSNYIVVYHIQNMLIQILRVKHAAREFL